MIDEMKVGEVVELSQEAPDSVSLPVLFALHISRW